MNRLETKNQIQWINTMKLVSCFFVFFSHFYSCFFFLDASGSMSVSVKNIANAVQGLANGTLWVMMFCFISGVFSAQKKITRITILVKESMYRYFRLSVPILFIGIIVFVMSQSGFIIAQEAKYIFGCSTFFDQYYQTKITISDVIRGVFLFDKQLMAPLWMMRMLLVGNIIIYLCNYISQKAEFAWLKQGLYIAAAAVCLATNQLIVMSCLMGAILSGYILNRDESTQLKMIVAVISLVLLAVSFINSFSTFVLATSQMFGLEENSVKCLVASSASMLLVKSVAPLNRVMSNKTFKKMSLYSFEVFLVHWPVMCSFSLFLFKQMFSITSYDVAFVGVFIMTIFIVAICALVFHSMFDELINAILRYIKQKLNMIKS